MMSYAGHDPSAFHLRKCFVQYNTDQLFDLCLPTEQSSIAKAQYCGGPGLVTRAYNPINDQFVYCCRDTASGAVHETCKCADVNTLTAEKEKSILAFLCRDYFDNCVNVPPSLLRYFIVRCGLMVMLFPVFAGFFVYDKCQSWLRGGDSRQDFEAHRRERQRQSTFLLQWNQRRFGFDIADTQSEMRLQQIISLTPQPSIQFDRTELSPVPPTNSSFVFQVDDCIALIEFQLQQQFYRLLNRQAFDCVQYGKKVCKALHGQEITTHF